MIRILHTIDTTGPGGAETVFVNLIKGLDPEKFESVVAIRGPGWVRDELERYGIKPLFLSCKRSFDVECLFKLVGIIRSKNIDVIQSHLLGSNLYCSLAGLTTGVPVISTFHGFVDINAREKYSRMKRGIINQGSARLVFVSDSLRRFYTEQKGFSNGKSVTVYNGVDTSIFRQQRDESVRIKLGLKPSDILVGAVGNVRPSKGYDHLLRAARLVVDQCPQIRFAVAGEGGGTLFEELIDLRKRLGLEKHFFFIGFEPNVPRFLNGIDVFVLSSLSEGFSISTIEAMACGVPVVATRCGGPEEIVDRLGSGVLINAGEPKEISDALVELCREMANDTPRASSIDSIETEFSLKSLIRSYEGIYGAVA